LVDVAQSLQALKATLRRSFLTDLGTTQTPSTPATAIAITFDLTQALLARGLPDRVLLQRNMDSDAQVIEALSVLKNRPLYEATLE